MLNIRPYNNKELLLFPASVGDYLPKNDLAHIVDEAVEQIDKSAYYGKISPVGNPAYDPALLIKVWFYGYCVKTYSSRGIEDKLHKDVAFIYLAGMQKPNFRTISDFRKNNIEELTASFADILQICHWLGLTNLGDISIDSKSMKANASGAKSYDDEKLTKERQKIQDAIEEYLDRANRTDEEEDRKYGPDKSGSELPEDIQNRETRIGKIKQIARQLKDAQEKLKQSGKKKINLTDEDAQGQYDKSRVATIGYRVQVAVDSKEQVIVANDVINEQHDHYQLIPMIDKALESAEKLEPARFAGGTRPPINITADSGYFSGKNFAELERAKYKGKIEPYVPDTNSEIKERGKKWHNLNSPFNRHKFIFNEKENTFTCPAGKTLYYIGQHPTGELVQAIYQCRGRDCTKCQHFGICTTNKSGRRIAFSQYYNTINKMRRKLFAEEGKKIYGLRKITVEPVLGNLSHNLGFREFLLRGTKKVKGEFSLMCNAHNLLKIAAFIKQAGITLKKAIDMPGLLLALNSS